MPLLQDNQDPDGLAALVAYHLHRLGITTTHLTQAAMSRENARQLRRGSLQLAQSDVQHLVSLLQLDSIDLLRPLTEEEQTEWKFYRLSARHSTEVWLRVAKSSTAANVTQRELSHLLAIPQRTLNKLLSGKTNTPSLQWDQATKLADVLNVQHGAQAFIFGLNGTQQSRDSS